MVSNAARPASATLAPVLLAVKRFGPIAGVLLAALAFVLLSVRAFGPAEWIGACLGLVGLGFTVYTAFNAGVVEREETAARLDAIARERRRLEDHNLELAATNRELELIFGAVRTHLLLIDPAYAIAKRYSRDLETIFGKEQLGDENFLELLSSIVSERMYRTTRDYLALLFDVTKKERTVLKVNPLDEVELVVVGPDGVREARYFKFSFRRIMEGTEIARVLVTIEDATDRTIAERHLRESEYRKVKQFELLIGILHVDQRELDGFISMASHQMTLVDEALSAADFADAATGQTTLLRERLDVVLRCVHNVKGNASLLQLDHFERQAHGFEQKVVDLKRRQALGGDDFLTILLALAEFRNDLDELQVLRAKLAGIARTVELREEEGDALVRNVMDLAESLGERFAKAVTIDADGFDSRSLAPEQRLIVKDVLAQLTRNSIAHGIEDRDERIARGKSPMATIEIHPMIGAPPRTFAFTFSDDGRGLDAALLRERAVALGFLEPNRAAAIDDSAIAGFIFASGFTTLEGKAALGRGMGMHVVKERVVDESGGQIGINSETGRFCELSFVLPLGTGVPAAVLAGA